MSCMHCWDEKNIFQKIIADIKIALLRRIKRRNKNEGTKNR